MILNRTVPSPKFPQIQYRVKHYLIGDDVVFPTSGAAREAIMAAAIGEAEDFFNQRIIYRAHQNVDDMLDCMEEIWD